MRLIVITHDEFIADEAEKINSLFEAGLEILHYRKPMAYKNDFFELFDRIDPKYYSQIKIHSFFELTDHYPVLGVHINHRSPVYKRRRQVNISRSCHKIADLEHIEKYDYVFLSPVFNSISKPSYRSKFTEEKLQRANKMGWINEKVFALGGVNEDTIPIVKQYPFGGIAVLGDIWKNDEVVSNYLKLKAMI
jgi:thiamine-phosphate pyrophosphorylase